MQTNDSRKLSHQYMLVNDPNVSALDMEVMRWFAEEHEVMWIPIHEVGPDAEDVAVAKAQMARFPEALPIRVITHLFWLPIGIKGWLFPAHLDNTDVVCTRTSSKEITFGHLHHPGTGERLTYRYRSEAGLPELAAAGS